MRHNTPLFSCLAFILLTVLNYAGATETLTASENRELSDSVVVTNRYHINSYQLNNDNHLTRLRTVADSLRTGGLLDHIVIEGYSSPDGPYATNSDLALKRAKRIRSYLVDNLDIPLDIISVTSKAEDWDGLRQIIDTDTQLPSREKVAEIIDKVSNLGLRETKLRNLDSGRPWRYMARIIFPELRRTVTRFRYHDGEMAVTVPAEKFDNLPEVGEMPYLAEDKTDEVESVEEITAVNECTDNTTNHWYIKTNIPAWAMLWLNAAVEFDIADHWSAQLPIYYSGFNYFKSTRKFRTFTIMPEIRWWPGSENQGFFMGAHFGMGYYNVACDGNYRYQDHDGKTPALGGGLTIGVRIPISTNRRWWLELSAGAGIYHLDYDLFINEHNGLLTGRKQRTFYGLDNAAVSIAYRFDLAGKKGGAR